MTALLVAPAVLVLALHVLVFSLCRASARGDDMARRALARRHEGGQR
jgi:hypothetical protein